ncbi:Imm1 family immunity protein [Nocardioides sp. AX2bis]|uniref:Imm1 family immunity protein n=1 Tax=Nocardioides sp. AX2bis TaxID=2653157 RepID=UPI00135B1CC9|nr:Imm1 family immunity protein [Nocardioides sp. AX2bis]
MADLHRGVTRFDVPPGGRLRRPAPARDLPLWAAFLALAVWHPLAVADGAAGVTATVAGVSLLAPLLTYPLPARARTGVLALMFFTGFSYSTQALAPYAVAFFFSYVVGMLLVLDLQWFRQRRWRYATAVGAPPSGRDPQHFRDVGDFAKWDDLPHEYEAVEPEPTTMLRAVRALDGAARSYLAIWHGRRILLVGGSAADGLVVMQSDDRARWHVVVDPAGPADGDTGDEVTLVFAGARARYPAGRTTDVAAAERAVRTWVERGERDPSLTWWREDRPQQMGRPVALRKAGA